MSDYTSDPFRNQIISSIERFIFRPTAFIYIHLHLFIHLYLRLRSGPFLFVSGWTLCLGSRDHAQAAVKDSGDGVAGSSRAAWCRKEGALAAPSGSSGTRGNAGENSRSQGAHGAIVKRFCAPQNRTNLNTFHAPHTFKNMAWSFFIRCFVC